MRQAGVLAAACLYGLSQAEVNIKKDNLNAKKLVQGIAAVSANVFWVNVESTETNIVHIRILKESVTVSQLIIRLAMVRANKIDNVNNMFINYFLKKGN